MKTLINMKCLILQIQPQCLSTYYGNVWNIKSIEKLMLCTYYLSLATIISNNPFWHRKCKCLVSVEWMCQQQWWCLQWSFCCCASEHMILSNESKHFHIVSARFYFVDLPSIFKEPACIKTSHSGAVFLFKNSFGFLQLPSQAYMHILLTADFFCFFFCTNFPAILDGINTCGFVFFSIALLLACLLLNSAT